MEMQLCTEELKDSLMKHSIDLYRLKTHPAVFGINFGAGQYTVCWPLTCNSPQFLEQLPSSGGPRRLMQRVHWDNRLHQRCSYPSFQTLQQPRTPCHNRQ